MDIQPLVDVKLLKTLEEMYQKNLFKIAQDNNLNYDEIKDKYRLESKTLTINMGIKKRNVGCYLRISDVWGVNLTDNSAPAPAAMAPIIA